MIYTVRFAHLADKPALRPGQVLRRGDIVGRMGNTGQSTAAHLHLDVVEGMQHGRYTLGDIANGKPLASAKQAMFFVDAELFGVKPEITTHFADPEYYAKLGKLHLGYDLVPIDRRETDKHFDIHWNRSALGRVVNIMVDDPGYGNCAMIAFEG